MAEVKELPIRSSVPIGDTWDLSPLFASTADWEAAFAAWSAKIDGYKAFEGTLSHGPEPIAGLMKFDVALDRESEPIGTFAFLKATEDTGDGAAQTLKAKFLAASSRVGQAASFIHPEIMAIPDADMRRFLADPLLADYRLIL
ncbi:MAG: oligoendopeptidase F, partial [Planctomycetia bacterium]